MPFNLPRKKKKRYKKDNPFYRIHWHSEHRKEEYEWFYFPEWVRVTAMRSIIVYPRLATKEELSAWYAKHYPEDNVVQHYINQLK